MELNMDLRQTQALSNQQIQSMAILQMSYPELMEYVNEVLVENPVIDTEEPLSQQENREFAQKLNWLESEDWQNRHYIKTDREGQKDPLLNASAPLMEENLLHHIIMQLDSMRLPKGLSNAVRYVAANLDENGYMQETPEALAKSLSVPVTRMEEAFRIIRTLNPAGIGASDLTDCLDLQLARMEDSELPRKIVRDYLKKVSKSQYSAIAKALNMPESEIRTAIKLIQMLNPRPGAAFDKSGSTNYIRPDIIIVKFKDYFEIQTVDYDFPKLNINTYYKDLLEKSEDKELTDYLGEKIRQAKWVINSIDQRRSTLIKCAKAILEAQEGYFKGTTKELAPLTMADLSDKIGIHESTVSRAIKGKYLQCVTGVYPLRFFFSRKIPGEGISADGAKRVMRELIESEDKISPLSDQKIAENMNAKGIEISRRTVAKYRKELYIPNTSGRKL